MLKFNVKQYSLKWSERSRQTEEQGSDMYFTRPHCTSEEALSLLQNFVCYWYVRDLRFDWAVSARAPHTSD